MIRSHDTVFPILHLPPPLLFAFVSSSVVLFLFLSFHVPFIVTFLVALPSPRSTVYRCWWRPVVVVGYVVGDVWRATFTDLHYTVVHVYHTVRACVAISFYLVTFVRCCSVHSLDYVLPVTGRSVEHVYIPLRICLFWLPHWFIHVLTRSDYVGGYVHRTRIPCYTAHHLIFRRAIWMRIPVWIHHYVHSSTICR